MIIALLTPVMGDNVLDLLVDVAKDKVVGMISTLVFGDENLDVVAMIDAVMSEQKHFKQTMVNSHK